MEQQLTKTGTEMMIYDIIQQHQSELKLYRSQVKYYGFSEKLYEQIQDFKNIASHLNNLKHTSQKIHYKHERDIN